VAVLGFSFWGATGVPSRVVFVGGKPGNFPSLDLTFPPTGLSENLGRMERGRGGKGKGGEDHLPYFPPPTGFCLKYHPGAVTFIWGAHN